MSAYVCQRTSPTLRSIGALSVDGASITRDTPPPWLRRPPWRRVGGLDASSEERGCREDQRVQTAKRMRKSVAVIGRATISSITSSRLAWMSWINEAGSSSLGVGNERGNCGVSLGPIGGSSGTSRRGGQSRFQFTPGGSPKPHNPIPTRVTASVVVANRAAVYRNHASDDCRGEHAPHDRSVVQQRCASVMRAKLGTKRFPPNQ